MKRSYSNPSRVHGVKKFSVEATEKNTDEKEQVLFKIKNIERCKLNMEN